MKKPFFILHFPPFFARYRREKCLFFVPNASPIIPLREKTGNYDYPVEVSTNSMIIPLREKTGNYDVHYFAPLKASIIPLREKTGNYD